MNKKYALYYLKEAAKLCKKLGGYLGVSKDSVVCYGMEVPKMLRKIRYNFVLGDFWLSFSVPYEYTSEAEGWANIRGVHWDEFRILYLPRDKETFKKLKKEGWKCKEKGNEWVCWQPPTIYYSVKPEDLGREISKLSHSILFAGRYLAELSDEETKEIKEELKKLLD